MKIPHITATGFDADGVSLISPARDDFDALVDSLTDPWWSETVKEAVPWVVIIANETTRRIVAIAPSFQITDGRSDEHNVFYVAPDAIASTDLFYDRSSERAIAPGGRRLIGINFAIPEPRHVHPHPDAMDDEEFAFYADQIRNWVRSTKQQHQGARRIHITIDAVIFDDGSMLGDDRAGLAAHFDALVRIRQEFYRTVLRHLDSGCTVADAVEWSTPAGADVTERFTSEDHAANEATHVMAALRRSYGDAALPDTLRRAILAQPFVIRRMARA